MSRDKRIIVGGIAYVIDESRGAIETIVSEIRRVLADGGLAEVPVLAENGDRISLYLVGGQVSAVVVDTGLEPPRPNEMSP